MLLLFGALALCRRRVASFWRCVVRWGVIGDDWVGWGIVVGSEGSLKFCDCSMLD